MGSGTSKDAGGPHSLRSRVSSCFALPPTDDELVNGSTKGDGEITSKSTREMDIVILPLSLPQHQYGEGESSRARSRFGFIPERIGLRRLRRTISLRSSRGQTNVTDGVSVVNSEVGERSVRNGGDIGDNQNDLTEENGTEGVVGSDAGANVGPALGNLSASGENRRYNRRLGHQEPSEGSVRFSRTRSVGRLRDRVLRRASSTSSGMFGSGLVEDRFVTASAGYNEEQIGERRVMGGRRRLPLPPRNEIWPDFARSHRYQHVGQLTDGSFDHGSETSNHDLVENRSTFLERRRRIRSQVRALQRLGSRFENLSGHERSCILSGQHRTGQCECRVVTQNGNNPSDDTRTRASISRIVMLAEALFEVLDEIHQHSVALSSRPSFSSIGSVPAPKEVVECMPVKVYTKPQKQPIDEEAAQCYICLVEYDDGDFMRILPCNHEFHQSCIDKWLKEIHRVCPLCRGDVCRSDAFGSEDTS